MPSLTNGTRATVRRLIAILVVFEFFHWFRPSEPFLVDVLVHDMGIPREVVYDKIFPLSSYAMLPCALLSGAIFEWFGFGAALVLASVADVTSTILVLLSDGALTPLMASQVTFAMSFTTIFLVTATVFLALPPSQYQRATSFTRAATLIGTILSSLLGQGMTKKLPLKSTLWGSLAGTGCSLLVVLIALLGGWLRPVVAEPTIRTSPRREMEDGSERSGDASSTQSEASSLSGELDDSPRVQLHSSTQHLHECLLAGDDGNADRPTGPVRVCLSIASAYRDGNVLLWSIWGAGLRSAHTLVLTYWQNLFEEIAPGELENGYVYAGAYLLSAVVACMPAFLDRPLLQKHGKEVMAVGTVVCSGLLLLLGWVEVFAVAAALFVLFHSLSEGLLVLSSAHVGRSLVKLASATPEPPAVRGRCNSAFIPLESEENQASLHSSSDPRERAHFAAILSGNAFVGMAIQLVIQAAVGKGGLSLSLPKQFVVFGGFLLVVAAAGLGGLTWLRWEERESSRHSTELVPHLA